MKKVLCSFIFMTFIIAGVNAQVIQGTSNASGGGLSGDMMFGAKAGFGFSTFLGRDFFDITPTPGFYVGGLAEIPAFFDGFYLQPEVVIQLQGADIGAENLNLVYLHIPVMAKYHITDEIAVEFGPQVGFLVADNWDEDISIIDTKKVNIGLNIGGGYRMNENFYFNLRISPGLTRVLDGNNIKNFAFQVGANYFF
ncbi:PorT family protein [Maribacter algarum]|uniref:PorT family protein n=1 Tax=Maribacter algarum (ex Zhang et al. 2020) TaxID=2578118 RepID=A0A5S3PN44_9FLAO|nr:porin family protein [Maribacter algarum]TMM55919.1 PorT family protein [Maribacter algarum]